MFFAGLSIGVRVQKYISVRFFVGAFSGHIDIRRYTPNLMGHAVA
jgi:hypothetical protein